MRLLSVKGCGRGLGAAPTQGRSYRSAVGRPPTR